MMFVYARVSAKDQNSERQLIKFRELNYRRKFYICGKAEWEKL